MIITRRAWSSSSNRVISIASPTSCTCSSSNASTFARPISSFTALATAPRSCSRSEIRRCSSWKNAWKCTRFLGSGSTSNNASARKLFPRPTGPCR